MNNILHIVKDDLCVSCGACKAICPHESISFTLSKGIYVPHVSRSCTNCRLCLRVCPSVSASYPHFFVEQENLLNLLIGENKQTYIAFAKDPIVRSKGTSGGVVSQIMISLISKGYYDEAWLLDYQGNGGRPILNKAKSRIEILSGSKSKYIPASIDYLLYDMVANRTTKRVVVGTPCQLLSLYNFASVRKISLNNTLLLGLFCDRTLNLNVYNFYKYTYGAFEKLDFRNKDINGWPGDTLLVQKDSTKIIDRDVRIGLKPYFQLNRCRYCFDKLNIGADISLGDCYIEGETSKEGNSSMIVRTPKGLSALHLIEKDLDLKPDDIQNIITSQALENKLTALALAQSEKKLYSDCYYVTKKLKTLKFTIYRMKMGTLMNSRTSYYLFLIVRKMEVFLNFIFRKLA